VRRGEVVGQCVEVLHTGSEAEKPIVSVSTRTAESKGRSSRLIRPAPAAKSAAASASRSLPAGSQAVPD
jgi:hypothetical protein